MLKIHPISGFDEVGKTMIVVETENDAFVLDMGLYLPALVSLVENSGGYTEKLLRSVKALPDDISMKNELKNKIRAILIGHAHLDHVGAVPFMEHHYNADIYGTPFTMAVLDELVRDGKMTLKNKIRPVQVNGEVSIKGKKQDYKVEFINITHSTLQTALVAIHTPSGIIVYANDFKMDETPVMGEKPNYEAIRRIAKEGVKLLIIDSLYSRAEGKTASEEEARKGLRDVMMNQGNKDKGMIITTFSSHIPRLKSIVEFGKKINREVVFLGRSLNKYNMAAKRINMLPYEKQITTVTYRNQVFRTLKNIAANRKNYLVVCTGHQGEPGSILDRLSRSQLPYKLNPRDQVIFSSRTIPTPENLLAKEILLKQLYKSGAEVFEDIHVSGHGQKGDLKELINLLQPEHVIPSHGHHGIVSPIMPLLEELGYKKDKTAHILENWQTLDLK
jgi:ribonuclease J